MKQANKSTRQQRIDLIMKLMSDGLLTFEIVDRCTKEWNVKRRAVEKYITLAYEFIREESKAKNTYENLLSDYQTLIRKYEAKDPKLAMQYRFQRDKILGLTTQKVDVTSNGKDIGISEVIIKIVTDKDETKDRGE